MQTKSMERRIEKLEWELTPELVAKLGMEIMSKCWYKDRCQEEIDAELETWIARYMLPRTHSERLEIVFALHHLETRRLLYEYAKIRRESRALHTIHLCPCSVLLRGTDNGRDEKDRNQRHP